MLGRNGGRDINEVEEGSKRTASIIHQLSVINHHLSIFGHQQPYILRSYSTLAMCGSCFSALQVAISFNNTDHNQHNTTTEWKLSKVEFHIPIDISYTHTNTQTHVLYQTTSSSLANLECVHQVRDGFDIEEHSQISFRGLQAIPYHAHTRSHCQCGVSVGLK